jgi:hypothetical protein
MTHTILANGSLMQQDIDLGKLVTSHKATYILSLTISHFYILIKRKN